MLVGALLGVSNVIAAAIISAVIAGTAAISPVTAARVLQLVARYGAEGAVAY